MTQINVAVQTIYDSLAPNGNSDNLKNNLICRLDAGDTVRVYGQPSIDKTFTSSKEFVEWYATLLARRNQQ